MVDSLDLSQLDNGEVKPADSSRKGSRGSNSIINRSRSSSPVTRIRPQSAPSTRKLSSTAVPRTTVGIVPTSARLAVTPSQSDPNLGRDKPKTKATGVPRPKSANMLQKKSKKSDSMPNLHRNSDKPPVVAKIQNSLFQHANGTVVKDVPVPKRKAQNKPLSRQYGRNAVEKPKKLTMHDKMDTLLNLFQDEEQPQSNSSNSKPNSKSNTDRPRPVETKKHNLYGAAHDGTYNSHKFDTELKLDHLGLPSTDYLENDTTAVISSPGLEKRINTAELKRTASDYSQRKLKRQASLIGVVDKTVNGENPE